MKLLRADSVLYFFTGRMPESYDDIFFWRSVLSEFENDEREFQVMLPSRTNLSRGKKQAMTNFLGEGAAK